MYSNNDAHFVSYQNLYDDRLTASDLRTFTFSFDAKVRFCLIDEFCDISTMFCKR